MTIFIASTLTCLAALVVLTWLHTQYHLDIVVFPSPPPQTDLPLISIIVPARNEERNICRCVDGLLAQTYPNLEIIILDDRSTDATPRILDELSARAPQLRVLHGAELPPGWAGKPHALAQAAAAARGDWLLFVDADTFLAPEAVVSTYLAAREHGADLFTILTRQEMVTFWERTVLPLVLTALSVGFSPRKVNDPGRRDAIANGQFILIKRDVYAAIGGHAAVRDSIVDDKDLAELVKGAGYRLVLADGRSAASTRMYTSLPEMWEGWTKNIYLGLKDTPSLLMLGVFGAFLALAAALLLPFWLAGGLIWWYAGSSSVALAITLEALAVWGYLLFWRVLAARDLGVPAWYALTTPLGAGLFAVMMLVSAYDVLSGKGVVWKGRRYQK
ncbi:MAG: glycosyltransferase [Chloroflexi bacterium]|nr:glycosyltransferase [Chloroflexota bacterium]